VDIKAPKLLSAYWRRRCPQLSYHSRCPPQETIQTTQAVRLPLRWFVFFLEGRR